MILSILILPDKLPGQIEPKLGNQGTISPEINKLTFQARMEESQALKLSKHVEIQLYCDRTRSAGSEN